MGNPAAMAPVLQMGFRKLAPRLPWYIVLTVNPSLFPDFFC
jgi:hypothetical protein